MLHRPIETLSKGFKRRVGIAQAIMHDPPVLVLDEPTDGLDPNQKHEVRKLIAEMGEEKAIIISTHILEEVEAVCTRAVVIARGRIVADATAGRAASAARATTMPCGSRSTPMRRRGSEQLLGELPGVAAVEIRGQGQRRGDADRPAQGRSRHRPAGR